MDTALSVQGDRPRVRGRNAKQHARQLRAARADDPGEAHDFTGAQIEIHIVNARGFAPRPRNESATSAGDVSEGG